MLLKIQHEANAFERFKTNFVLMIIDIDNFKQFNDQHGHDCGDYVLRTLANDMKNLIRKQDSIARWGGEEFLILFPKTDFQGGMIIAEKIRTFTENKVFCFKSIELSVTLTIGISMYGIDSKNINEVIKKADQALYKGKNKGKNCVIRG